MTAVVAGDHAALEALHLRYNALVWRIAARILCDDVEAEDVTQDVFLEVYQRAHLYDEARGTVRVWLAQYAYHRAFRRKSALRLRAAYRGLPLSAPGIRLSQPSVEIAQAERAWLIEAGLPRLSANQRATIELVCFEDLPLWDAAHRLGVSLGCARHYYYRAVGVLRGFLAEPASAAHSVHRVPKTRRHAGPATLNLGLGTPEPRNRRKDSMPRQPDGSPYAPTPPRRTPRRRLRAGRA